LKLLHLAALALASLPGIAAAQNVTTYHNDLTRHGDYVVSGLTASAAANMHMDTGFNATVSGHVYAQPLYWKAKKATTGDVIVATESNIVYALNASTGAVVWQTQLAPAAALSNFPCGNIDPEGVTGTPVIDQASGTLYLNALTKTGSNAPLQLLYALSVTTGKILPGWPIDVQASLKTLGVTFSPLTQGQRSAALFFEKNLYIVYGGKSGDCGTYAGTVVQVDPTTPALTASWETRANGGGIWSQGGLAGDGKSLFITTGNTKGASQWGDGEAILRLKPGLAHSTNTKDYYTPANWQDLDNSDADLGGTEALPIEGLDNKGKLEPRVIAFGKDGKAYLTRSGNLGGVGGQIAITPVSTSAIITAPAVYTPGATQTMVAFTNSAGTGTCTSNNLTMLNVAAQGSNPIKVAWCATFAGRGAPIITTTDGTANPLVWVLGASGDSLLHGYNVQTGASVFGGGGSPMAGLHHFQTLIAAEGRFYIGADNKIYAFTFAN
jgi:hypothetical protein